MASDLPLIVHLVSLARPVVVTAVFLFVFQVRSGTAFIPQNHSDMYNNLLYMKVSQESNTSVKISVSVKTGVIYFLFDDEPLFGIAVNAYYQEYDTSDKSKGQVFYHRLVTKERELNAILCLIDRTSLVQAYAFTWNKFTYDQGKEAGTFQSLVAIVEQLEIYIIRMYDSAIVDMNPAQFALYDYINNMILDVNVKAADMAQRRVIDHISRRQSERSFSRVEGKSDCEW